MAEQIKKQQTRYQAARSLQEELRQKVIIRPYDGVPRLVAGADCAFSRKDNLAFAAVVVLELETYRVVEQVSATHELDFPYIPGLLSFRELPVLEKAFAKLESRPEIILADGQGYAHPRRFGLACHLGVALNKPTIGCAKSRLIGEFEMPDSEKGSWTPLLDNDEIIGVVLRSRTNVKPLFISAGHLMDLESAQRIVMLALDKYRLPEPTRIADKLVAKVKRNREVVEG